MELLLPVAGLAVAMVIFVLRDRAASRRRRRVRSGEAVSCRALLGEPTGRLHRGELQFGPGSLHWTGGRLVRSLTGAHVLTVTPGAGRQARQDDALLRLRLLDGSDARLLLHEADAILVTRHLREQQHASAPVGLASPMPPARGPRWPLALLALVGIWLLAWVYLAVGGRTVTATVTANDGEGGCDVTWTSLSGQQRTAFVDCGDESAGSRRDVWELARPLAGEAVDPAWTVGAVVVIAALAAAPAVISVVRRRSAVELGTPCLERAAVAPAGDLPPLTPQAVAPTFEPPAAVLAGLAPYAARQVPAEGWQDTRKPRGAAAPAVRDVRRVLLWPAIGLAIVLILTAPAPWRWYILMTADTATATATSTGETAIDGPGPLSDEITVEYADRDGTQQQADVATTDALPEGEQVPIEYAVDKPGWARIDGSADGLLHWLLLAAAGSLAAAAVGAVKVLRVVTAKRAVEHAAQQPARPALACLTGAPDGQPLLLICDAVTQPAEIYTVPLLTPLPHGTANSFPGHSGLPVQRRGALAVGQPVVIDVPGVTGPLWPSGAAWRPEPEELLFVLDTANALADELGNDEDDDRDDKPPASRDPSHPGR